MNIGIIDADLLDKGTNYPNLALMKISAYKKEQGHFVNLLQSYNQFFNFDHVYISKVFSFTKIPEYILDKKNITIGGTGFFIDGGKNLDWRYEHHMPDYNLYLEYVNNKLVEGSSLRNFDYYTKYSLGFTTRGCFRKCNFCVNKKYDHPMAHSPVSEFLDTNRPYISLLDDNFLAFKDWERILDDIESTDKPFQFKQGLDIRLLTSKSAKRLSKTKYLGDFIFAFDYIKDRNLIEKKLNLWREYNHRTTKLYILCAFESQDEKDLVNIFERLKILMSYGCIPYLMRYQKYKDSIYKDIYIQLARWCNQPQFFKKMSFREFCEANQYYHKNKKTLCKAYKSMLDFEIMFPLIAKKYFNLKYEKINRYF